MKKNLLFFIVALMTVVSSFASNNAEEGNMKEPVVFRLINGGEPASLDPAMIQGVPENRIYQSLFEGLVAYDYETARAIPGVAQSWTVSDDNTVYTFKLRQTSWNDGVAITAQTFVDSWLRELDPNTAAPYAWFPSMFVKGAAEYNAGTAGAEAVGVKAIDDYTLEVTLVGPLPYALDAFAHYSFGIAPLHTIAEHGDSWTNVDKIVTNGPYKLKEWVPQDKLVVEKDPKYWDAKNVKVDQFVYLPVEDNNTGYSMFLNGEVDWMTTVPTDRMKEGLLRDDVIVSPNLATYYYVINNKVEPLTDVRVRKALSMSINRTELTERIGQAGQIPSAAMVPTMEGYPALEGNTFNVAEAKKLLAEAGYPNGEGFPVLPILYNTSEGHKKMAEFIQAQWKENLGIDVTLENQEWKTFLSSKNQHDYSIARSGWGGDYQDPNTFLDMFVTGAAMNDMQYENPEYDALIEKAATMKAGAARFEALREAESMLVERDQALIPLYTYVKVNCIDLNKWGGWAPNVLDLHPPRQIYKK
ncbi:peptide ABC transporter substrate-binding protein [Thiospirochaeta perfilievii]|nr:peptide ABC transporter substrate-binding protein [Thiospirochaeta perfilievii]